MPASQTIAPHRRRVLSVAGDDDVFPTCDAVLEWYSVEHRNVAAAVELAAEWRMYDLAWKLIGRHVQRLHPEQGLAGST